MNIILQKQLSKSVQICKLFSRLEVLFPVSFFGVGGGRKEAEEGELRGGGGGGGGGVGDFVCVRQSLLFMNSHV
jgi:hypothetical protein